MSSSTAAAPSPKVSFTVRRPTPVSRQGSSGIDSDAEGTFKVPALPRHLTSSGRSTPASPLANGSSQSQSKYKSRPARRPEATERDSSDEEEETVDEIVTGFDQFGVQRLVEKPKPAGPLVIPALANRDWRAAARKRKAGEIYVPPGAAAQTGADGSVGGLGTKDAINAGPQVAGLVRMEKKLRMDVDDAEADGSLVQSSIKKETVEEVRQETDDERAMRALVAGVSGESDADGELTIDAIPLGADEWEARPADETDAYRRDIVTRPDLPSLEDYERVPVEQFGQALLRGMGWKPGQAASRTRTGLVEPYLPAARPALLGIGAKEREAVDDGSKMKKAARPERRYVPVVKKEREGSGKKSGASSRRTSRSPEPERKKDMDERRERDGDRERDMAREKDRDKYRDYERRREREPDRDRRDRRYESERDRHKDSDRRRDYDRSDRDRDRRR
ncbi:DExH-box splicing factor binding site-domain-containing protein [Phellopilus nigrolimitatus]|nr:DExH-box splicing factor binding site-domain-containing protein [Phellopilus nigrolimitatus]